MNKTTIKPLTLNEVKDLELGTKVFFYYQGITF